MERRASSIGADHGKNAASWAYDGNTSDSWYVSMLKGIEDGDPVIMDSLRVPDLSGEFSDDYTSANLAADLGISQDNPSLFLAEIAYLDNASEAFWSEIERVCRKHVNAIN